MKGSLLLYNSKLNSLIFFYQSKLLTDYIYRDIYRKSVNYRNALDRLRVRINIILFIYNLHCCHRDPYILRCTDANYGFILPYLSVHVRILPFLKTTWSVLYTYDRWLPVWVVPECSAAACKTQRQKRFGWWDPTQCRAARPIRCEYR